MSNPNPLDPALLQRLDQLIALMEEQTYYLSLLITEDNEEDAPSPEQAPEAPTLKAHAADDRPSPSLAEMLVNYLNTHRERVGPPHRSRVIVPWVIPTRPI